MGPRENREPIVKLHMNKNKELKVFVSTRESTCDECGENLGPKAWITLTRDKGALCLACADLDHLIFLPPGDAALTRRARKHSTLAAVVLKWSRTSKDMGSNLLLTNFKIYQNSLLI